MEKKYILACGLFIFSLVAYVFIKTDVSHFMKEFSKTPMTTGAIGPSSWFVSRQLATSLVHHKDGIKILEAGAGTGAVTTAIAKLLKPNDVVDVIEINPQFCDVLKDKFRGTKHINVHCLSLLDWNPSYKYDVIISTLPFSAFDAEQVRAFVQKFKSLSNQNTSFTYIEYMWAAPIKGLFLSKTDRANHASKNAYLAQLRKEHGVVTVPVWLSIPPAYIHHLTF